MVQGEFIVADKPTRILHVLGYFDYGGAEALVMNIFRQLDQSKITFDFVVHGDEVGALEKKAVALGSKVYRVPQYTGKNHISYRRAWKQIFEDHPEYTVIHGHVRSTANIYLKIAKKYGLETIAHSHSVSSGTGLSAIVKNVMQRGIRNTADYFLACSVEAGEWLFGEKVISQPNFNVMKNAIHAEKYLFNREIRDKFRKRLGLEDQLVIGHVGRFHEAKNHVRLINIFNQFQKEQPNSVLLLIGDGETQKVIKQEISTLELGDKVRLLGSRNDTDQLLQAMDIFLFPSLYEGLGISVVEAQASGLPSVVSTAIPEEAIYTDLVHPVSLEENDEAWVSVMNRIDLFGRENHVTLEDIQQANYEIKEISRWYVRFIHQILSD